MNGVLVSASLTESENSDLPTALAELRALIQSRKLTKEQFDTTEFQALWKSVKSYLHDEDPSLVWIAFSTLGRMAEDTKPAKRLVEPVLSERLETDLPTFVRLPDGKDRYYLARSLEGGQRSEIVDIAYKELAREEVAETCLLYTSDAADE